CSGVLRSKIGASALETGIRNPQRADARPWANDTDASPPNGNLGAGLFDIAVFRSLPEKEASGCKIGTREQLSAGVHRETVSRSARLVHRAQGKGRVERVPLVN